MRSRPFHLLVALATFCIALVIVTFYLTGAAYLARSSPRPSAQRIAAEDEMAGLIFRHAIDEHLESCDIIFLNLEDRGDPTDYFMKRFENYAPRVKKGSQSGIYQIGGYTLSKFPSESRCKLTLTYNADDQSPAGERQVTLSTYTTSGHESSYVYRLTRKDDAWTIVDVKLGFIK